VVEKKGQAAEADVALSGLEETEVLMTSNEDNTSQGKGWIFDSGSMVHVCSQKELFNSLVAKDEGIVKMINGSTCKVIGTRTVKVIERDGTMRALEAVRYVPEACYNLISKRVLDEEGCRIQMQQGVVTVSQRDRVILEGEKCEGLYKLKEGNSARSEVSRISLEGSSSRGGALRRNGAFREGPR